MLLGFESLVAIRFLREGRMQSLLIIVGVALDTIGQIEAHLVSRQYEGFVKGTRVRGRLGR